MDLARKVKKKHEEPVQTGKYPKQDPADPQLVDEDSIVTAMPIDWVYEHGFYLLHGSFRSHVGNEAFEVFGQWVEILPNRRGGTSAGEILPQDWSADLMGRWG
jgi:hypothetical protein